MIIYRQPISKGGVEGANRALYGDKQTFIYTYAAPRLAAEHKRAQGRYLPPGVFFVRRSVPPGA